VELAELTGYDIGGLSSAIVRYVPSDRIRYIFGATGEGWRDLHTDPTHELDYSNYMFSQSNKNMHTCLLSNEANEDPLDMLVNCHRPSNLARPATPLVLRHRYLTPNTVSN